MNPENIFLTLIFMFFLIVLIPAAAIRWGYLIDRYIAWLESWARKK